MSYSSNTEHTAVWTSNFPSEIDNQKNVSIIKQICVALFAAPGNTGTVTDFHATQDRCYKQNIKLKRPDVKDWCYINF